MNSNFIVHRDLVHLYHHETKSYLTDTEVSYKTGYIVGTQKELKKQTIWMIEKYLPQYHGYKNPNYQNTEIWPGDLVILRSYATGNVVTSFGASKSLVTKQGEMILTSQFDGIGEQQFIFITSQNDFSKVYLLNVLDQLTLHSHNLSYKTPKNINEVTGFKERDNNDIWKVVPIDEGMAKMINHQIVERVVEPRIYKFIHHLDRIVLRNYEVGGSLHSHNEHYKHGNKSQEVSWRQSLRRDVNDIWIILLSEKAEVTDGINDNASISLFHQATKTRLYHYKDARNKHKDYLEVCSQQINNFDFQIEGVNMGIDGLNSLICEYPFRIKHINTGQYLCALNRQSSKTTFQGEVVLDPRKNGNTIWVVEMADTLFD